MTNREIALHYVRFWFWVDMTASSLGIASAVLDSNGNAMGRALRPFLMLRLLRPGRWNRVPHMIREALAKRFLSARFAERWSEIVVVCIVAGHLCGCIYYCIADLERDPVDSWTFAAGVNDAPPFERYTTALYWAFATMTTVGYGDVACTTYTERIAGVFVLLIGAMMFSFLVGKMGVLSHEMDQHNSHCRKMLTNLERFLLHSNLPLALQQQVREYYGWTLVHKASFSEKEILMGLSPSLRQQVILSMKAKIINLVPLLKHSTAGFQIELVSRLQKTLAFHDEYIIVSGNMAHAMYFIESGEMSQIDLTEGKHQFVAQVLTEGSFFGEKALLTHQSCSSSFRVRSFMCILYALERKDFKYLSSEFPEFEQSLVFAMNMRVMKKTKRANTKERRPQTPPPGRSWAQVRNRRNKFQEHYEIVMGRSRTLQSTQYRPKPLNLSNIILPPTMDAVVEFSAQNFHETWAADKVRNGWRGGEQRDNAKKIHPLLVQWNALKAEDKENNLYAARNMFKMIQKLGYAIVLPEGIEEDEAIAATLGDWNFGTIDIVTNRYVPNPCTGNIEKMVDEHVAHALSNLIDDIAEHLHDIWAKKLIDDGWKFGRYDVDMKMHHGLIPYAYLSAPEKKSNTSGVQTLFEALLVMKFRIVSSHDCPGLLTHEDTIVDDINAEGNAPPRIAKDKNDNSSSSSRSIGFHSIASVHGTPREPEALNSKVLAQLDSIQKQMSRLERQMASLHNV